jgi:cytochrome d ubiquinol oxidase subunit I
MGWDTAVKGLDQFDENTHPTNISGLYYAYHIMVGLGTVFYWFDVFSSYNYLEKSYLEPNGFLGFVLHDAI